VDGDAKAARTFIECARSVAQRYRSGELKDALIDDFFSHDRCVRESGHDTTFRWYGAQGERCADFATVELNALLFKFETDVATLLAEHFDGDFRGETTGAWCRRAAARKTLMRRYHWDETSGLFFDYDVRAGKRANYISAAALVPLWASSPNACGLSLLDARMARASRDAALPRLEAPGGLTATARDSLQTVNAPEVWELDAAGNVDKVRHGRQWEYPNGWAPHQMLAWFGLRNFGFHADAERLALRWLRLIVDSAANYHGTVPEKFDVVQRTHQVFEEYGNVNTEFSYITREGFGWMNASFLVGLTLLDPQQRSELAQPH
jgi:alpha,alpha-trehalase